VSAEDARSVGRTNDIARSFRHISR
jgi:hypothetical protein